MITTLLRNISFKIDNDNSQIHNLSISDKDYLDFLEKSNGGYFFSDSLHIYGLSNKYEFHDILN